MNDKTLNCFPPENGWPTANNFFPNYYQNAAHSAANFPNPHASLNNCNAPSQTSFPGNNQHPPKYLSAPCPPYRPHEPNSFDGCSDHSQVPRQNVSHYHQVPVQPPYSNERQARHNTNDHIEMNNANNFPMADENCSKQSVPNCAGDNYNLYHFGSNKNVNSNGFLPSDSLGRPNNHTINNQESCQNSYNHNKVNARVPLSMPPCVQNRDIPPVMYNIPHPVQHPNVVSNSVQDSGREMPQSGQFHIPSPAPPPTQFSHQNPYGDVPFIYSNSTPQQFGNSGVILPSVPPFPNLPYSLPPTQMYPAPHSTVVDTLPAVNLPTSALKVESEKEANLNAFLQKFSTGTKEYRSSGVKVVEFRSTLKLALKLSKMLHMRKDNLTNLLHSSESEWQEELAHVAHLQAQLSEACAVLSVPDNLSVVQKKLKMIQKRRLLKLKQRQAASDLKLRKQKEREVLSQEIDKWLDGIKEKNLKLKREAEMKKEADNILAEVRRKIQEANKTIEKIKVFEKLRAVRQRNAAQKGLFIAKDHDVKFEEKMTNLKATMLEQLSDYEAEERALRVMLETEQEGQLEEEALWRIQKMKVLQQKKQDNIRKGLFGTTEELSPADPLFFFHQHQNSGNSSIENLVQIRHHWDVHLAEDGDPVPLQWVVPTAPSSSSWEICLGNG